MPPESVPVRYSADTAMASAEMQKMARGQELAGMQELFSP